MCPTTGVLPLPPTRRLPTLMTGRVQPAPARRGSRGVPRGAATRPTAPYSELEAFSESMHQAEGTDDAAVRRGRAGSSSAITASVLSLAPRLASTSARAAAPRRARRTGSVTSASSASSSSRSDCTCTAASFARNVVGDLLEVLHVRPEHDRLAEDRRLEDVVAAVIDQAAADEHRGRQLIELRQLADRVEHDDVGARLGVDRQLASGAIVTKPASRASRSTSPNRSGWRGARIAQRARRRVP